MINEKINILGTMFHNVTRSEAADILVELLQGQKKASVFTPNPEIVIEAYNDESFRDILNESDLTVADGIGVVIGSKLIGKPLKERVAGYDLLHEVFAKLSKTGHRIYFFGAAPTVADLAKEKMCALYPGLKVVGVHDGYFSDDNEVIEAINATKPDLVIVGLGAPKQEKWIYAHKNAIDAKVFYGCGGSFDAMAGVVKRAPKLFIKLNLEWFYRLIKQPKRAKRMLRLPLFLIKMIIEGKRYD